MSKEKIIAIIIIIILEVVLYTSIIVINNQQDSIEILQDSNYYWCNSFSNQAKMTEWIIQYEWNESFKYESYPNCDTLKR